jgi:hypothetical protein
MLIPARSRWWVFTLLVVAALLLISSLALNHPDVVWSQGKPLCPYCRHPVEPYSHRCAACGGEFDWVVAPPDTSPISSHCLSVQEAAWLHDRVSALGAAEAARRVAHATGLSEEAAAAYLGVVNRGDCGWCGGTRRDLSSPKTDGSVVCPACFGTGDCVDCGPDRRVTLGAQGAARALAQYDLQIEDLRRSHLPGEAKRAEAQRLARAFLVSHEGTREAQHILFWPEVVPDSEHPSRPAFRITVVQRSRERLERVLKALEPK